MKADSRLYIIGAGFAGRMILRDIEEKKVFGTVAAFLDDDKELIGSKINSIPVLGPIDSIADALRVEPSEDIAVIAIPSAPVERIREIYSSLKKSGFEQIKILPSVSQVIDEKAHFIQARDINPLDILGRTPVVIPLQKSLSYLKGKRVLITGAGGSIGSELARQLLSGGAERLYLFGHGENSIVNIYRELHVLQNEGVGQKASVVPIIGDMKDREYVRYIISHTRADVIFHCAAYKHVPMMEENSVASIENNVFGTKNLLDAALEFGTERFVLISTDKAVSPVSVYGVSKMLCEKLVLEAAEKTTDSQAFMFVRFGNVLGSRGSILPIFMDQIKNGASYLLDMGEPVKILDLAKQIIRFAGFVPEKDIGIQFIGCRRGERLTEPLWLKEEKPTQTEYKKILSLTNVPSKTFTLSRLIEDLKPICTFTPGKEKLYRNSIELKAILRKAVPELDEFYTEQEKEKTRKNTIEESAKVVL